MSDLQGAQLDLQGAQLLANLLALPAAVNNQRLEGAQTRAFLREMGVPTEQLGTYAPGATDNPEPLGGTGTFGKILSGVGQTGAVLSQVLGAPIKAPRMTVDEQVKLKSLADDRLDREEGGKLAGTFKNPAAQALARRGKLSQAYKLESGGGTTSLWKLLDQEATELGLTGPARTKHIKTEYERMQAGIAGARATATGGVTDARRQSQEAEGMAAFGGGIVPQSMPDVEQWRPMVEAAAAEEGVDPEWAMRVLAQESRGNPKALSPKGAIGLMQLMPATAQELGVDPQDPQQNIRGGVRYLGQQFRRFNGDKTLASAAYNAGPHRVDEYGGVPPFKETRDYVQRVAGGDEPGVPWRSTREVREPAAPAAGGLPVTSGSVQVGTAKLTSDDLELKSRGEDWFTAVREFNARNGTNIDPNTKDDQEVAAVNMLLRQKPGMQQAQKEQGTMAAKARPILAQIGRQKLAIEGVGSDGLPLLLSKKDTGNTLETGAQTTFNNYWRLRGLEQGGDQNVKDMNLFGLNMAGLAKALGDSGNISDTMIEQLTYYATGFTNMTREEAAAALDGLERILTDIAAGAPHTLKDPAKGAAVNQQILEQHSAQFGGGGDRASALDAALGIQ